MKTIVVNIRRERCDVYIGPSRSSVIAASSACSQGEHLLRPRLFGNPLAIGCLCLECGDVHRDAGSTLPCFEAYFLRRLEEDPGFRAAVLGLRGRRLGCFCKPGPCHGDIIAAWLDGRPAEKA